MENRCELSSRLHVSGYILSGQVGNAAEEGMGSFSGPDSRHSSMAGCMSWKAAQPVVGCITTDHNSKEVALERVDTHDSWAMRTSDYVQAMEHAQISATTWIGLKIRTWERTIQVNLQSINEPKLGLNRFSSKSCG
jgi:hypothetical protein